MRTSTGARSAHGGGLFEGPQTLIHRSNCSKSIPARVCGRLTPFEVAALKVHFQAISDIVPDGYFVRLQIGELDAAT